MTQMIPSGVTDQWVYFDAFDSSGNPLTGLTTFTVYRSRNGGTSAQFTTPTITEVNAVDMPGVWRFQIDEDTTIDNENDCENVRYHITHAGMVPVRLDVVLYRPQLEGDSDAITNATRFFTIGYGPLILRTTVVSAVSQTEVVPFEASAIPGNYLGCVIRIRNSPGIGREFIHGIVIESADTSIKFDRFGPAGFTIGANDIIEIYDPAFTSEDRTIIEDILETVGNSGGGSLSARIGYSSLTPDEFLEIIQGEEKTITFVVEADGRFEQESADAIRVGFRCPESITIIKEDEDVERVCEALDIQVIRVTLSPEETYQLTEGLLKIEIAFDTQKAGLTRAIKIVEGLIGTGT